MENIILLQDGFILFFRSFFIEVEQIILFIILIAAAIFDIKTRRIPNKLIFPGALIGIAFHTLSPYGIGTLSSLGGMAVGLAFFLPLYIIRAMGAGDVKLMAMVGAFLGPASAFGAVITTLLAGGTLALLAAIKNRSMQSMLNNVRFVMTHALVGATTGNRIRVDLMSTSAGKLPYGVAIAIGTILHLLLKKYGYALLPF